MPVKVGAYIGTVLVLAVAIAYVPSRVSCDDSEVVGREILAKVEPLQNKWSSPNLSDVEICSLIREEGIPLMKLIVERLEIYKKCQFKTQSGEVIRQDIEKHLEALKWAYASSCAHVVT